MLQCQHLHIGTTDQVNSIIRGSIQLNCPPLSKSHFCFTERTVGASKYTCL